MSRFSAIDLSKLDRPVLVPRLTAAAILPAAEADFVARMAASGTAFDGIGPTSPVTKLLEVGAYREQNERVDADDAAVGTLLPWAGWDALVVMAAAWGLEPLPGETVEQLRLRVALAPEALTVAGSVGAYEFWARSVNAVDILDVGVSSPEPLEIHVALLIRQGADITALIAAVASKLNARDMRPMCDVVTVFAASWIDVDVHLRLHLASGPASEPICQAARRMITDLFTDHRLGRDITIDKLMSPVSLPEVTAIDVLSPGADLVVSAGQGVRLASLLVEPVFDGDDQ